LVWEPPGCASAVAQLSGAFEIRSALAKGTVVTATLPFGGQARK
jgi:hypothetical protein